MPQNAVVNIYTQTLKIKAKKFVDGTNQIEHWRTNPS